MFIRKHEMATKGEERLKNIINEYFEQQQRIVSDNALGIFVMGIATGIILSYTSMISIIAGFACGYSLARKKIPITDVHILKIISCLRFSKFLEQIQDSKSG
jgi:hypothetical protein